MSLSVCARPRSAQPAGGPPTPPKKSWIRETAADLFESASLLVAGSLFLKNKTKAINQEQTQPPLADVNDVKMKRPLVICPGWHTEHDKFHYLTDKLLASGLNGDQAVYLHQGKAFSDWDCTLALEQIPSNSKVFVNIWDDVVSSPDQTAPQIQQNLDLVRSALGPGKVDLLGYSMGGLAGRKFLDNGGTGVANLMTLGTPHQGTRFAQMSARVIERDIQWALKFSGLSGADAAAMHWLSAGSPQLEALNARWPQQRAQVDNVLMIGGKHELTPAVGWLPFRQGDGMDEPERTSLPGVPAKVLEDSRFLNHCTLPHDSKVFGEMESFFGFESLPNSSSQPLSPGPLKPPPQTPYGEM